MYYLIAFLLLSYAINFFIAPFPHWPTYFKLWQAVLSTQPNSSMTAKIRQAGLLLRYLLSSPLFTFLWYLDKLLYPSYTSAIIKPIFIIGEPRSGTTLLHRTLAADEETFFAIRHYEWRYPYISLLKIVNFFRLEQRIKSINYWPSTPSGNQAAQMHPNTLYDYEEDGTFFEENFLHHLLVINKFPYTHLVQILDRFPELPLKQQHALMNIHKEVLQKICYLRGTNKLYLSKEVLSHKKLALLTSLYPKAKFIVNLRQPSQFLSSWLELTRLTVLTNTGMDTLHIKNFYEALTQRMKKDCSTLLNFMESNTDFPQIWILFEHLSQDLQRSIIKLYELLQLPLPVKFQHHLATLQQNQQTRQSGYTYKIIQRAGFESFEKFIGKQQFLSSSLSTAAVTKENSNNYKHLFSKRKNTSEEYLEESDSGYKAGPF